MKGAAESRAFRALRAALLAALLIASVFALSSCGDTDDVLYVYNWGEYISDGTLDSVDVIAEFEDYYEELTGRTVKVYYSTYASNEDLYAKIAGAASEYDVIVPSEYMVQRMISEHLLLPLNIEEVCDEYGAVCYLDNIDEAYLDHFFDPGNVYSVPYTVGRTGIIYNSAMVDEEDCGDWDLLWNEKYSGKILQFNNVMDAFSTALYSMGSTIYSEDPQDWRDAHELLAEQKPLVQGYVLDEVYNKMESGEAWIAPYYVGDFLMMQENNEDLDFYYPEDTCVFIESMCIPKCSQNQKLAALFINYMQAEEPAVANAEYILYTTPNRAARENGEYIEYMGEDWMEMLYPEDLDWSYEIEYNAMRDMDPGIKKLASDLWEDIKINGGLSASFYVVSAVLAAAIVAGLAAIVIRNRKREKYY